MYEDVKAFAQSINHPGLFKLFPILNYDSKQRKTNISFQVFQKNSTSLKLTFPGVRYLVTLGADDQDLYPGTSFMTENFMDCSTQ